jgi:hypothetical protein
MMERTSASVKSAHAACGDALTGLERVATSMAAATRIPMTRDF